MAQQDSHYLSISSRERSWGIFVTGAGHATIEPFEVYPPALHPVGYDFQWERGRILEDYALVYLVNGSGVFESLHQVPRTARAGDCMILFPGEWHRYKPDLSVGWEEYWVLFRGKMVESWKQEKFICPETPLLSLGDKSSLSPLFEDILRLTDPKSRSRPLESAAMCHLLLAQLLSSSEESGRHATIAKRLRAAGNVLRQHPEDDVDLPQLAERFGMSYSSFRRSFTKHFGESPDRFRQTARIARMKQFLIETDLPLKEIAARLRFSNEFYMMRVFKRHTGMTPTQWRRRRNTFPV